MSAENWMRRASGLVVPAMGFANPMGRFQACPGDCCFIATDCRDCYTGGSWPLGWPAQVFVDIPAPADDLCPNCDTVGGVYALDRQFATCNYAYRDPSWNFPAPCGGSSGLLINFAVRIISNACVLQVNIVFGNTAPYQFGFIWRHTLSSSISTFDHILDFLTKLYGSACDFDPDSTVHVYE